MSGILVAPFDACGSTYDSSESAPLIEESHVLAILLCCPVGATRRDLSVGARSQQAHHPICACGLADTGQLFQNQSILLRSDSRRIFVDWNGFRVVTVRWIALCSLECGDWRAFALPRGCATSGSKGQKFVDCEPWLFEPLEGPDIDFAISVEGKLSVRTPFLRATK